MTPTEICDALNKIAGKPFDRVEFPFEFALATGGAVAAIDKLRSGTTNKSDLPEGVLFGKRFHYVSAPLGQVATAFKALKASKKNKSAKPAILLATDGQSLSALDMSSGETLHCAFDELDEHYEFFLPVAGKKRYQIPEEAQIDVKATRKLGKLYGILCRVNPDWASDARRHEMNQLMMRLIFCMFAEDVGIFPKNQFSRLLATHSGERGEGSREVMIAAFQAMNRPKTDRQDLPAWTGELEYVNGGLFAGPIDVPIFNEIAFKYLREACDMDWRDINPDIFGSMIQSVADPALRAELGLHYTSVSNIMKVLGPLFLDELDQKIEAVRTVKELRQTLRNIGEIRIFDPACGSGNFLVVAYRQLREREMRILKKIEDIERGVKPPCKQYNLFSAIPLRNFHGIELTDFAAETAKLALYIAEYQANAVFAETFGTTFAPLPLKESAHIVRGNALRLDWDDVCLPQEAGETYIVGNPPFLGKAQQNEDQKADMDFVFKEHIKSYRQFDLVTAWYFKAASYIKGRNASAALVATNSICQGASASSFWPEVLGDGIEIAFAYQSFKWKNKATDNAAVVCVIVGLHNKSRVPKKLFSGALCAQVEHINAYLVNATNVFIQGERQSIFSLPKMILGNRPYDNGSLLLDGNQRKGLLAHFPNSKKFIRKFMGSQEAVKGIERYCLWIDDADIHEALKIPFIEERIKATYAERLKMKDAAGRALAKCPYQFRERHIAVSHAFLVPRVTSERRPYLPVDRVGPDVISSDQNQVLYDAPDWCLALIASRLHLVWISTVCGKLKSDFRYSNTLGWNTFPVPDFASEQLEALSESTRSILQTRYSHYPKTIAELYDPGKMPDDLRAVHKANDNLLESMYIGRPFANDTERLEHLFKLYAARIKRLEREKRK